jgi:hypothetical protein
MVCTTVGLVAHDTLSLAGSMAINAGAFISFGMLFLPSLRPHALTMRRVVLTGAFLVAVAVITPPRGSYDIWSYTMYGRILSVHHTSPFTSVPAHFPRDHFLHLVASGWRHTASVYGPAFVALAGVGTAVAGQSVLANRLFFQGIEAAALAGALVLIWRRTRDPAAVAFLGLNPAVVAVVNGGHNDLLAGLAILAGTLLLIDDRPRSAGVVLAVGALVKLVVLLPVGALLVWAWHRKGAARTVPAAATLGVAIAGAYAVAGGGAALAPLLHARTHRSRAAVWQLAVQWLLQPLGVDRSTIRGAIGTVAPLLVVLAAVVVVISALRRRGGLPVGADVAAAVVAGAAGLVFLLGASYVLPWYSTWTLPLLAVAWRSRVAVVATMQAAVLALAYTAPLLTGGLFAVYAQDVVPIVSVAALWYLIASARRGRLTEPVGAATASPERDRPDQLLARW